MVASRRLPPRNLVDRIVGEKGLAGRDERTAAGYAGVAIKRTRPWLLAAIPSTSISFFRSKIERDADQTVNSAQF